MKTCVYRISDICSIKSGKRLPEGFDFSVEPTKYKYIRSRDIKAGKICLEEVAFIDEETKKRINKYIINAGDVAITIVANIGDIGYATQDCDGMNLTENAVRLTGFDKSIVFSKFLSYYLSQPSMKQYMENLAAGAAQAKLGIYKIEKMKVQLPDVSIQKAVVDIIEKFDNLIEVNSKRIKVLEQMAENLYKEWFVRFRFPGYETSGFENGIPKGWNVCRFSSIANVLSGGTPSTDHDEYYGGNIPFYTPKDSSDDYFVFDTISKLTEEGLQHCNSQLYPKNTIMITARGTVGNLNLLAKPMAMKQSCYALTSNTIPSQYFLFFLIKREILKLRKMASGGVFDTIIVSTFDHIKVTIPDESLIMSFDRLVSPILDETYTLLKQNRNLIRQRDLLLPRLMSGKLEV